MSSYADFFFTNNSLSGNSVGFTTWCSTCSPRADVSASSAGQLVVSDFPLERISNPSCFLPFARPCPLSLTILSQIRESCKKVRFAMTNTNPIDGTTLSAQPQEVAFYQNMFALYSNTMGTPTPVLTCPLDFQRLPALRHADSVESLQWRGLHEQANAVVEQQRQREFDRPEDRPHHRCGR